MELAAELQTKIEARNEPDEYRDDCARMGIFVP